ncbi:conserved uncharacterized protein [Desulfobacula toluolica Tol2]|uniref:Conserved uncharacterized protein n=2 Tax=Desulfobacula TaxID=28222 RepID=K0NRD1_DESTT|nr:MULTISPECIES: hypothetical protein [Desulfobacula]CCK81482.1 conserved uncharacterized protein [Desulfobacula toluolica Tol2]SDU29961.1 hypothetical protein SAMN04487931_106186 [Desulfobacula phenolica]
MKKLKLATGLILSGMFMLCGCVSGVTGGGSASQKANAMADEQIYQPITYENAHIKGPVLVVLPGKIKSNNATFAQKITSNNIADYAELELGNANFRVLERSDLGPMLNEITLAANMGDTESLKKFRKGKFKTTKWFAQLDVLKAEKVAQANQGFGGDAVGSIFGAIVGGKDGFIGDTAISSIKSAESAGVWIIGMRYKIMDASTSEQVSTGYFEDKMELGKKGTSILGLSQSQAGGITMDSMVQRLVQKAVADIDRKK